MSPFIFNIPLINPRPFQFNTNLFKELRRLPLHYRRYYSVGNILLLFPFGLLIPMIYKQTRHFITILILGFLCSLSIELTQAIFTPSRTATVDDLFFNTLGAILGYLSFSALNFFYSKLKKLLG
jgi:glycopeptide antibiotics resistance protein